MPERRLLERIRDPESGRRSSEVDTRLLLRSVLNNLQRILNTRQGNVPIQKDFGIPDFSDVVHTFPESILTMQQAIRKTINQYEPRLKNVRVKFVPQEEDIFTLHFEVIAQLDLGKDKSPVTIFTELSSDGTVKVRE